MRPPAPRPASWPWYCRVLAWTVLPALIVLSFAIDLAGWSKK